ncbi:hypothetical protein FACS189421_08620 [Bacteroidia bacterium]|nr:hypothetical protein FACS189421_08620 [Bacteroidia bacterium]
MDFYSSENGMKHKIFLSFFICIFLSAFAQIADASRDAAFQREVREGLDLVVANRDGAQLAAADKNTASGALGREVYNAQDEMANDGLSMFIPTDYYMRGGVGYNLGFISGGASGLGGRHELNNSYGFQMGFGLNMTPFARAEFDFQNWRYGFDGLSGVNADARSLGANLYFDLARRYVRNGDVHIRRTFVPFLGVGIGGGSYRFPQGESGGFFAPRAMIGMNLMLTDLFGIDLTYQYQMFVSGGFGWDTGSSIRNLNDIMLTARFNF